MKNKIIILLSLLLISISSYSYAGSFNPYAPANLYKDNHPSVAKVYSSRLDRGRSRLTGLTKKTFTSRGYGMKIIRSRDAYGMKVYSFVINLPCFYTAPNNTPCDRGRFRR